MCPLASPHPHPRANNPHPAAAFPRLSNTARADQPHNTSPRCQRTHNTRPRTRRRGQTPPEQPATGLRRETVTHCDAFGSTPEPPPFRSRPRRAPAPSPTEEEEPNRPQPQPRPNTPQTSNPHTSANHTRAPQCATQPCPSPSQSLSVCLVPAVVRLRVGGVCSVGVVGWFAVGAVLVVGGGGLLVCWLRACGLLRLRRGLLAVGCWLLFCGVWGSAAALPVWAVCVGRVLCAVGLG